MSPIFLLPLANHLWQSTLFAAGAGLLTLLLRGNFARVRYWIWVATSLKFLIPFSVLFALGASLGSRTLSEETTPTASLIVREVAQPFQTPVFQPAVKKAPPPAPNRIPAVIFTIWACGSLGLLGSWALRWRRLRAAVRTGSPLRLNLAVPAISSSMLLEPGIFGVFRPVLILPEDILEHLTPAQLEAIIAHELCHVRHQDNLMGAIQMVVETVFWFHPLAWWVGRQMVEERERACDEEVARRGCEPRVYAEAILKVCKLYTESRLVCVSGITGPNLKKRIVTIMKNQSVKRMGLARKAAVTLAALSAASLPVVIGMMDTVMVRAQSVVPPRTSPAFEVASIKQDLSASGRSSIRLTNGRITMQDVTLKKVILNAFGIPDDREYALSGPDWLTTDHWDIEATFPANTPGQQVREMLQTLLADRFKMRLHRETRQLPMYWLVIAKNGPKIHAVEAGEGKTSGQAGNFVATKITMRHFADLLARQAGLPVVDSTKLEGVYDFTLNWSPAADLKVSSVAADEPGVSIFTALQEQLGLKLESGKGPVEVLAVDSIERKPTAN
jgi:uncharacterized protein (TIGR03435 family)